MKCMELNVDKLWPYIKEALELNQYLPELKEYELPERENMCKLISTINPEATSRLIKDSRKYQRSEAIVYRN